MDMEKDSLEMFVQRLKRKIPSVLELQQTTRVDEVRHGSKNN
jgi:hypothetical protein